MVHSDDTKIMNCFLEYDEDKVTIYDIVHEKSGQGWKQYISHYQKIKIPLNLLKTILLSSGFEIRLCESQQSFNYIIAEKL